MRQQEWTDEERIEIRKIREQDIAALQQLEQEIFSDAWSYQSLLESFCQPYTYMTGAFLEKELVGYAILYRLADDGEIERLAVDVQHRRHGIAGRLLEEIRQRGKACNMQRLLLEVRESNVGAIAFYRKHGFSEDGIRTDYYTDPVEDAILMSCTL